MKEKTCCFTGHRLIPPEQFQQIARRLEETIRELIGTGYTVFYAGGALGFDTLAAQTVLKLKAELPHIRLALALPCLTQTAGWQPKDVAVYEEIKGQADEVHYTSENYFNGCMHKRNRFLVDHSSVCVCYQTQKKGGTAYTTQYAAKNGVRVINVA